MKRMSQPEIVHRVFTDGAGQRPDGTGSGYAYYNEVTGRNGIKWVDGLTNNQAEYRGLLFAVRRLPRGSRALILSDSQLMVSQFNGQYVVNDPRLQRLLAKVREVIQSRQLRVKLQWIPRRENLAGQLMERTRNDKVKI
jgi:ribonuclease HI